MRECREGANIEQELLAWLDGIVSPAVFKGQSVHHAIRELRMRIPVSERTIYRYFGRGGLFTALRGDLPRACRLKPRKGKRKDTLIPDFWMRGSWRSGVDRLEWWICMRFRAQSPAIMPPGLGACAS